MGGTCGVAVGLAAVLLPFDLIYTVSAEPADQLGAGGLALAYGLALLMFGVLALLCYALFRLAFVGSMFPLWRNKTPESRESAC
jgi:hypothetical protein